MVNRLSRVKYATLDAITKEVDVQETSSRTMLPRIYPGGTYTPLSRAALPSASAWRDARVRIAKPYGCAMAFSNAHPRSRRAQAAPLEPRFPIEHHVQRQQGGFLPGVHSILVAAKFDNVHALSYSPAYGFNPVGRAIQQFLQATFIGSLRSQRASGPGTPGS